MLLCKAKRQYLLTCTLSRYWLLALHASMSPYNAPPIIGCAFSPMHEESNNRGHLFTLCWLYFHTFLKSVAWLRMVYAMTYIIRLCRFVLGGKFTSNQPSVNDSEEFQHLSVCYFILWDIWLVYNEITTMSCKAKRQYLLPLQSSRYCLLALQSSTDRLYSK